MKWLIFVLDLGAALAALLASVLWFRASRRRVRRVSYREEIDAADLNRIVVAINRAQILNARAALAAAVSALCVALRFTCDLLRL
ncbi:MAG TPA: hypothetical protein VIL65_00710 [Beijerinckiaceae bacterium]|jgi:membrane-bound ClpP family serine protease